ncbi:MAG TPA: tubulin-like doman-containing protein [Candidatus Dormibacteraeota bacterium]
MAAGDDLSPTRTMAQHRVLTPLLAIFPGTTAAHAALEFMHHARDLPEGDRLRIAPVHIDIDHLHPDLVAFRSRNSGLFPNEKIIRLSVPRHVAHIPRVEQGGDPSEPHTYIGDKVPDAFANGARGIRNNGHVALCHDAPEVIKNLNAAITQITSQEANEGLPQPEGVQVHITSFVGGGTASGIVADLACLTRQLLMAADLDPRIYLTCILPGSVGGEDSDLRRSNAVACMLEILALSMFQGRDGGRYRKYLRQRYDDLPEGPIAHEVFLIGSANMTQTREIARIAGLDLYHRTLDAAGVGALERSEAVNRISLGWRDDQGLPTMFGASCPLEARFPARETALAFAQMAAAEVLPLLAGYHPEPQAAGEEEQSAWREKWGRVARIDAGSADPLAVQVPDLPRDQYQQLEDADLDPLWDRVEAAGAAFNQRVANVLANVRTEEERRIETGGGAAPQERTRHWRLLAREYDVALADLRQQVELSVLERPTDLEHRAVRRLGRQSGERRLYVAHREHLDSRARNERRRLLEVLLRDLRGRVYERLDFIHRLASRANADQQAAELRRQAVGSAAWRAQLDRPHPFQVHALDLRVLGGSPAVARLYEWATARIGGVGEDGRIDHRRFLPAIAADADIERLERSAEQLSQAVVGFFEPRYLECLQAANLPQLLAHAAPVEGPQGSTPPAEVALTELLRRLGTRMTELVSFDARIGGEGCSNALKTEVFVGCQTGGGAGEARLKEIATQAGILRSGTDHYRESLDPHRLQISFQQHGISLGTIHDFFSPGNSAMSLYRRSQGRWEASAGGPPPHSCSAMEGLVRCLGLVELVVHPAKSPDGRMPVSS